MGKLKKVGILLFWLGVWQIISMWVNLDILLVSPLDTLWQLAHLVQEPLFWRAIIHSLQRIIQGFLLALIVAGALALLSIRLSWVHDFIAPLLNVIKTIPVVSFIILALVWAKSSHLSTICSFMMVLPIIYSNLHQGLASVPVDLLEVGYVFKLSKWKLIRKIYIPSLMPYLISACTVGLGLAWKSGVAAEVIGLPDATIGMQLYTAKVTLETADLFAWTLVIVLLSFVMEKIFLLFVKWINHHFQTLY